MAASRAPAVQVIALYWQDAVYHNLDDAVEPEPMLTFGVLLEETEEYLRIACEIHADGAVRHICVFPKHDMGGPEVLPVGRLKLPLGFVNYSNPLLNPAWKPTE